MSAQNPIAPYTLLNNATVSDAATYKSQIDSNSVAAARIIDQFLPHAFTTPTMGIQLDAGARFYGTSLTEVSGQSYLSITAAGAGNTRIDRACVNAISGVMSYFTGVATAGVAAPPAIPVGFIPIAQIAVGATTGQITNNLINDERWNAAQGTSGVSANTYGTSAPFSMTVDAFGRLTNAAAQTMSAYFDAAFASTQGAVLYRSGSGWTYAAPGSVSGQVFVTGGPAANPSWQATSNIVTPLGVGSFVTAGAGAGIGFTAGQAVSGGILACMSYTSLTNQPTTTPVALEIRTTSDALIGTWNPLMSTGNGGGNYFQTTFQRTI